MRMRVPRRYAEVEKRVEITRSLKTDSESVALSRCAAAQERALAELDAKLAGVHVDRNRSKDDHYRAIAKVAAGEGLPYKTAQDLAAGPLEDLISRMLKLMRLDPKATNEVLADALAGGVERPPILISQLPSLMETVRAHEWRFKSDEQRHIAMLPLVRAAARFIEVLGEDKEALKLTEGDAQALFDDLEDKRKAGELKTDTVNREISAIAGMLRDLRKHYKMKPLPIFAGMRAADKRERKARKLEIPVSWIETRMLAPGAMEGINPDFQDVFIINAETGTRQSEVYNTPPWRFYLDHEFPHMLVQDEDGDIDDEDAQVPDDIEANWRREIKNVNSTRYVPLLGVALAAAQRLIARGTYHKQHWRSYSNTMNKGFRARGLFPPKPPPGKKYTIGGTRHAFETRLKDALIHNDDRAEMMGHSVTSARNRELYGDEMPLARRYEIAAEIAFRPPPVEPSLERGDSPGT